MPSSGSNGAFKGLCKSAVNLCDIYTAEATCSADARCMFVAASCESDLCKVDADTASDTECCGLDASACSANAKCTPSVRCLPRCVAA